MEVHHVWIAVAEEGSEEDDHSRHKSQAIQLKLVKSCILQKITLYCANLRLTEYLTLTNQQL